MSLLPALLLGAALSASAPASPPADRAFFSTGDGVRIAYRVDGPADAPPLLLANSIGTALEMWDAQIPALSRHFRVVRYDMRGHGASGVPAGAYSIDRLGRDALELMDALGIERAHVLGLSLGGYVGQWLGIHAPERVDRLVLSNTAAWLGPPARWDAAIADVLAAPDMRETAEAFLRNWFPARMLDAPDPAVAPFRAMLLATDRQGLAGAWAAVRDADLRRTVALIPRPTLVVAGAHDSVTRLAHGEALAAAIPGARLEVLPTVHLSNVEAPEAYLALVLDFLRPDR
ncbi:3-oxoadipate enol-lactonase [Luteimonas sp. Y-2-2-4F]|nr:3-oxoadipate enol-lactonase [Luteimonas sp. Y-2-2-4F]MCD9032985.1 3-oxoadipate enol-lactonase [Luteimonas sp. Y-2-2-4F]